MIIQITDDEKFFLDNKKNLDYFKNIGMENIKDIIAIGFDPNKTFIFFNSEFMGIMYPEVLKF